MSEPAHVYEMEPPEDELEPQDEEPAALTPAGSSVIAALKAQRARAEAGHTFDYPVPGWNDLLVLRFGPVGAKAQGRILDKPGRNSTADVNANFLVNAFREALGRVRPNDELTLLVDGDGDPVGLDERLAGLLDLPKPSSARHMLELIFGFANSPVQAIAGAANDWGEWARGANEDVSEVVLGE